jgi:hypothetical protein
LVPISIGTSAETAGAVGSTGCDGSVKLVELRLRHAELRQVGRGEAAGILGRAGVKHRAALDDCPVEQPLRRRHRHERPDLPPAAGLAEDRDLVRVAAEAGDVVADPLQHGHQVEQADVCRMLVVLAPQLGEVQVAEGVEAVVVRDDDRVVATGQVFAVVREEIVARAGEEPAAVHPDHHRPVRGAVDLRGPDVDP